MTDSEKLDLLLDKVVSMDNRMTAMDDHMTAMDNRMTAMDDHMVAMDERMTAMDERMSKMENSIQVLQDGQQKMQDDILGLKQDQEVMSRDMKDVKQRVTGIEMTLENEVIRNIKIIAENHTDLSRKLDDALKVDNEKELLLIRVNILENEVRKLKERLNVIA